MTERIAIGNIVSSIQDLETGEWHVTYTPLFREDMGLDKPLDSEKLEKLKLSPISVDKPGDSG